MLVLTVLRLLWRTYNPPPQLPGSVTAWERRLAPWAHVVLLILLLAMPIKLITTCTTVNAASERPNATRHPLPLHQSPPHYAVCGSQRPATDGRQKCAPFQGPRPVEACRVLSPNAMVPQGLLCVGALP